MKGAKWLKRRQSEEVRTRMACAWVVRNNAKNKKGAVPTTVTRYGVSVVADIVPRKQEKKS